LCCVAEYLCVARQQQHVVLARDQFGSHCVVAQTTTAVHPARAACEIKNSHAAIRVYCKTRIFLNRYGMLKRSPAVEVIEEIAFVWLVPTYLISRHRANVQPVDV